MALDKPPPETQIEKHENSYFTLESSPISVYQSVSSSQSSIISQEGSQSYISDPPSHSYDKSGGSPLSGSSISIVDDNESSDSIFSGTTNSLDLKQLLLNCAEAISNGELSKAARMTEMLNQMVSVSGEPFQRLAAYALEGLKAKLYSSGNIIYKKLKCDEPPTSSEMMSYMSVLYHICPYYKFAYTSANAIIMEATRNDNRIHVIDFSIAQGSQWMGFIETLGRRPGGPPSLRVTGVDDSDSFYARGGGMDIVGTRLKEVADSWRVPFEFHGAAMSGCQVKLENLGFRTGEAIVVNFPYMLHHMPDESVNTCNHRDRLIRLVKSLSPKVMTLVEQESNTNTSHFLARFRETLDYYNAMFESIEAGCPKEEYKKRIKTEEHCVARDIVSIIACEGEERVQRHEVFGKWKARLMMAGFSPCRLSPSVNIAVKEMLKREFSPFYKTAEMNGALYLGWKNRAMATCSAWR